MNRLVLEMERGKTIVYTPFFSPYSTRLKIFLNGREQTKMSTRLASTCVCDFIFLQHSFLFQFTPTLTVCSDYTASTAATFFLMDWIEMDRNAILRLELHKEEVGKLRMQHTAHLLVFI